MGAARRYLLLSEFAFDLPGPLPDALTGQAVAGEEYRAAVLATAARLRDHTSHQEAYLALAKEVAETLRLPAYFTSHDQIGQIDTFAFEETLYLDKLGAALLAGDLAAARQILQGRQSSIWRQQPERQPLWRMAERCLALQETVTAVQSQLSAHPAALPQLLAAYSAPDGWQQLDRQQRLLEQSVATCPDAEPLNAVIDHCRQLYRELAERIQGDFLTAVQQTGWPPAGYLRQSQVFAHYVAPALARREKVVYVLADSLRLEMGYDLAQALADLGDAACDVVTAHPPTVTPFGMAALLPGADGALHLRDDGGSLTPYLGETRLKDIQDRKKFLSEKLGDRAIDVEISEFLSLNSTKKRQSRVKNSDLVILRDGRIDRFGESVPGYEARKYISGLLGIWNRPLPI
ncbi:MAG: PglZ domain-containing protein [bacterium]|nr:PglZ domain-containing protein [bacterium]